MSTRFGILAYVAIGLLHAPATAQVTTQAAAKVDKLAKDHWVKAVQTPVNGESVLIIYDKHSRPDPLTEEQIDSILKRAHEQAPEGRDLWFILVHFNRQEFNITIYFTPDSTTPRVRKGRHLHWDAGLEASFPKRTKKKAAVAGDGAEQPKRHPLREYWQVSLAQQPFDDDLGVPIGTLLPFRARGLADDEVVEIIDFARTSPEHFNGEAPILAVERPSRNPVFGGEDVIEVTSGMVQGMLAGSGDVLFCRKTEGGFEVLQVAGWVS